VHAHNGRKQTSDRNVRQKLAGVELPAYPFPQVRTYNHRRRQIRTSSLMSSNFRRSALLRAARLFDLALVSLTFIAAFAITSSSLTWLSFSEVLLLRVKVVNIVLLGGYLLLCSAVFSMCSFYLSHRLSNWNRQPREIVRAVTLITTSIVLLKWPFGFEFATNQFLLCYWVLTVAVFILVRMVGRQLLNFFRTHGKNLRTIVIVGQSSEVNTLAKRIQMETSLGYQVVRIINVKEES
jgi:FlaA1/EpsC-like NDP-sugar epimerase